MLLPSRGAETGGVAPCGTMDRSEAIHACTHSVSIAWEGTYPGGESAAWPRQAEMVASRLGSPARRPADVVPMHGASKGGVD